MQSPRSRRLASFTSAIHLFQDGIMSTRALAGLFVAYLAFPGAAALAQGGGQAVTRGRIGATAAALGRHGTWSRGPGGSVAGVGGGRWPRKLLPQHHISHLHCQRNGQRANRRIRRRERSRQIDLVA